MPISRIEQPIEKSQLVELAKERYGDLVKAVVDVKQGVMAVGGELHSGKQLSPKGESFIVSAKALPPTCGLRRTLHNR